MAMFEGTVQDFHDFLGPRLRNAINLQTKRYRERRHGLCEECGERRELQSAHVHGRGRRALIEAVLQRYTVEGVVRCELRAVEQEILQAHQPIETTFRFLCQACHTRYDAAHPRQKKAPASIQTSQWEQHASDRRPPEQETAEGLRKLGRIRLWARRPDQANRRPIRAYLRLEANGPVGHATLKALCSDAEHHPEFFVATFDGHFASMKTDGANAHGKVFCTANGIVHMWPPVRGEVAMYFERRAT